MKKVLQISNYYYPSIGGVQQVARDIAAALCGGDVEQRVICFDEDDGVHSGRETVTDDVDGVEVTRCGCFAKVSSQSISAAYGKQLKRVMDGFKPDVVIFHYPNPFVARYLLKYVKGNFKLILFWHLDITKQKILRTFFKRQNEKLLKRADKIVATSPNYIENSPYLSRYRQKCTVISCCIGSDKQEISPAVKERAADIRRENGGKTICFAVGRHVPYKGMGCLVEASKHLGSGYKIAIGGSGELTAELKKQAEGDDKIEFLGRLADDELAAWLTACDIFCFPSITKNEAFGIALAEAMSFGKPAVTFTIEGSGVNYVSLDGVTGIECPNGDCKAFAAAIETLAENDELRQRYGENARKRVLELFTFGQFKQKIRALVLSGW